jgi:hypothetical protein
MCFETVWRGDIVAELDEAPDRGYRWGANLINRFFFRCSGAVGGGALRLVMRLRRKLLRIWHGFNRGHKGAVALYHGGHA